MAIWTSLSGPPKHALPYSVLRDRMLAHLPRHTPRHRKEN